MNYQLKSPIRRGKIESFDFGPGQKISDRYEIVEKLGSGWESEVYTVRENGTGIVRAAKFFFPHRNRDDKVAKRHARKLHRLRHLPCMVQYHAVDQILVSDKPVSFLISEFVEGQSLAAFLNEQPGKKLSLFESLHLLYTIASGLEPMHALREYHGDIHNENLLVKRLGIGFNVKLLDFYDWDYPKHSNINDDVVEIVRLFFACLGGAKTYSKQPRIAKDICCGLKRSLILKKYRNAGQLRRYLETLDWRSV